MDHALRHGRAATQAFQVFEIAAMHLGPGGEEGLGARIRASEAQHLMAGADEFLNNGGADKTCRSGDENTHREYSLLLAVTAVAAPLSPS